jgi:transposase
MESIIPVTISTISNSLGGTMKLKEGKMTPSRCFISDSDWLVIQETLPDEIYNGKGSLGGRPHADLRRVLSGLLYGIRTGCQWELISREYGPKRVLDKYLKKWVNAEVFQKLMTTSLELYDKEVGIQWKFQEIDGSIKRAPGCRKMRAKILQIGPNLEQSI